jgi:hypothetical protein
VGTPKLVFGQVRRNDEYAYHVRIEKKRGKGKAKNCEGFITVEYTPVQDSTSVWSLDAKRVQDIGCHLELRIFRIERDSILFPMSIKDGEFSERSYPLNDFMERKPKIMIYSDNASVQKPEKFDKTIRQIIEEGDKNFNVS